MSAGRATGTTRPVRLVALVQKAAGIAPNQRFRIEQWMPHLAREHDIRVDLAPFESPALTEILYTGGATTRKMRLVARDALRRWRDRAALREADGVVVVREAGLLGGAWLEGWLARSGVPFVYDFDDAIWMTGRSAANGLMSLARMPWKTGRICELASAVTVGNEFLAEYARRRNPAVHLVRTSIDIDRFPELPPPPADDPFVIVWTGTHSTLAHLDTIRPALERLAATRRVRLRVICDRPPQPFERVEVEFVPWRAASEAADLAGGHVGVMPLPDTPFARGKCGCKALQYMAIGRPAVVSPVGINTEIVREDDNGLLASTEHEWLAQLRRLADDPALRARLGQRGRETVLRGFTARASAAAFATAVEQAVRGPRAGPARPERAGR